MNEAVPLIAAAVIGSFFNDENISEQSFSISNLGKSFKELFTKSYNFITISIDLIPKQPNLPKFRVLSSDICCSNAGEKGGSKNKFTDISASILDSKDMEEKAIKQLSNLLLSILTLSPYLNFQSTNSRIISLIRRFYIINYTINEDVSEDAETRYRNKESSVFTFNKAIKNTQRELKLATDIYDDIDELFFLCNSLVIEKSSPMNKNRIRSRFFSEDNDQKDSLSIKLSRKVSFKYRKENKLKSSFEKFSLTKSRNSKETPLMLLEDVLSEEFIEETDSDKNSIRTRKNTQELVFSSIMMDTIHSSNSRNTLENSSSLMRRINEFEGDPTPSNLYYMSSVLKKIHVCMTLNQIE